MSDHLKIQNFKKSKIIREIHSTTLNLKVSIHQDTIKKLKRQVTKWRKYVRHNLCVLSTVKIDYYIVSIL